MKIFLICPQLDCANAAANLAKAISKYTEHEVRLYSGMQTMYDMIDMHTGNFNLEQFMAILEEVDVVHFNAFDHTFMNTLEGTQLKIKQFNINWQDYINKKPFIFHSHGGFGGHWTDWVKHPKWWKRYDELGYKKVLTCSAMETKIYKESIYMQNIIHLDEYFVNNSRIWERLKIVQTPSSPPHKSTDQFIMECNHYQKTISFNYKIILGKKHKECVQLRGSHHLTYENSWCGYHGYAGLESLAQGLGAMVYQEDLVVDLLLKETGSEKNPFIRLPNRIKDRLNMKPIGTLGIEDPLKTFANDMEFTKEYCESRRDWMEKFWRVEDIVKKYIQIYEEIL